MKASLIKVKGLSFLGKSESNVWVPIDGKKIVGGAEAGASPMELILLGLGGCTSMDVVSLLRKKKVDVQDFQVEIDAERADSHPKVFTNITVKFIVTGKDINQDDVRDSIKLSMENYCSVSAMLKSSVDIQTEYEIINI